MLDLRPNLIPTYDDDFDWLPMGGEIGFSLVQLHYLEHLDLSYNDFTTIPKFIDAFTNLRYLNLSKNPLVGTIPPQLGNLTKLHVLDLTGSFSKLTTKSFKWLSHLSYLKIFRLRSTNFTQALDWFDSFKTTPSLSYLHLHDCQFPELDDSSFSPTKNSSNSITTLHVSGSTFGTSTISHLLNLSNNLIDLSLQLNFLIKGSSIPDSFENLRSLRRCYLFSNQFEGEVPKSMKNLCHLRELVMVRNSFTSTLLDILESLKHCNNNSLEILNLGLNKIEGYFPDFEKFPMSLKDLNVRENKLSGSLPIDISKMLHLRELDVSNNKLNGTLPKTIGKLSFLNILDISKNFFTGVVSEPLLGNLSKLHYLDLSSNSLTLELPFNWIPPFQLQYISLRSCMLGPHFPSWLQTQSNVSYLDLSSSGIISNTIPKWFFNLTFNLYYLDLSFNLINSTLPNIPLNSNNFPYVDLSSNKFHGHISPNSLFKASVLNLSNNTLTKFVHHFCTTLHNREMIILDLSNNHLWGSIPDCWFHLQHLQVLNLHSNRLSGVIPNSISSLHELETLHLRNNSLSGTLPSTLKNCTQLTFLDVGENKMEGTIPPWIGETLKFLVVLQLKSNNFYGTIPSNLCHLHFIQIFDISQNNIHGAIPSCINNFTSMVEILMPEEEFRSISVYYTFGRLFYGLYDNNAFVRWKGKEYEYENILGLLRVIDLSSNRLVGEIPKGLTNLVELVQLNLSRNNLSGVIPENIGNLSKLESLDLSHNNFYGSISMGLAKLSSLAYLDLSYNHFSGRIPTATQLQSFKDSSYFGNFGLCGPPLLTACPGDEGKIKDHFPENKNYVEHDQEMFDMSWFYIGLEVGFALGFIGVCGTLFLSSKWRIIAYFRCLNSFEDWLHLMIRIRISKLRRHLQS
ncbi:receptor-like protein EIX2 [Humulus lupulus]|uniref:receptor-like protein EIX2 n=1 Tax=Humulus lupulus TaxID=3486 RepID=UPI002B40B792|nr:receptor-like protein EIX2 [Humulus lupulus]